MSEVHRGDSPGDLIFKRVTIESFRAITFRRSLPLGHVTLLCGPNGLGKTTIFDALDWALFGSKSRLGQGEDQYQNLWRRASPVVSVHTSSGTLTRTESSVKFNQEPFRAQQLLLDPTLFARNSDATAALRRLIYLPQHEIRELVEGPDSVRGFLVAALSGVPFAERFARNLTMTDEDIVTRLRATREHQSDVRERMRSVAEQLADQRRLFGRTDALLDEAVTYVGIRPASVAHAVDLLTKKESQFSVDVINAQNRVDDIERVKAECDSALLQERDLARALADALKSGEALDAMTATISRQHRVMQAQREASANSLRSMRENAEILEGRVADLAADVESWERRSELESSRASLQAQVQFREADVVRLSERLSEAVAASRDAVAAFTEVRARAAEARRNASHLATAQVELQSTERRLVEAEFDFKYCSEMQERAWRGAKIAEHRLRSMRQAFSTEERVKGLAAAIEQLIELWDPSDGRCPTCAHDYTNAHELRIRMFDSLTRLRAASNQGVEGDALEAEFRDALASADSCNTRARRSRAVLEDARRQFESASDAYAILQDARSRVAESELEGELAQAASRVATTADQRAHLQSLLGLAESELERTRVELERAGSRLLAARDSVNESSSPTEILSLRLQLSEARDALRNMRRDISAAVDKDGQRDVALRSIRAEEERADERRASLTMSRSHLAAQERALERVFLALAERIRSVGASSEKDQMAGSLSRTLSVARERSGQARERHRAVANTLSSLAALSDLTGVEELEAQRLRIESQDEALRGRVLQLTRARDSLAALGRRVMSAVAAQGATARARCQGIIDAIMGVLSPHQHLNSVFIGEDGQVRLLDELLNAPVRADLYSSAGQANLVGLAVFLGVSLGTRATRVRTLLLDEPVQNLDDVNVLNFLDLVRGLARTHQVILSSADSNLAELLKYKFAIWAKEEGREVVVHEFRDFDRESGPDITTHRARLGSDVLPGFDSTSLDSTLDGLR